MTAIKRDPPPPPGPVAELFDRLDQLHLTAGRPSMRDIAHKAGRGRISSSTVHNVFRRSKVPRWIFVEEIVKALDGDPATFKALWEAAWQAENRIQVPVDSLPVASAPARARSRARRNPVRVRPSGSGRTRSRPATSTSPAGSPNWKRCRPT